MTSLAGFLAMARALTQTLVKALEGLISVLFGKAQKAALRGLTLAIYLKIFLDLVKEREKKK